MGTMRWLARMVVGLLCAAPVVADETAETPINYARPGFYVGIAGNYTIQDFDLPVDVSNSLGASGRIGYRWHPVIATEVVVDYFDDFNVQDLARVDGVTAAVAAKLYSGLFTGRVQPYISGGLGIAHFNASARNDSRFSQDGTELLIRVGGGLDVYVTEQIALNVEVVYSRARGSLEGLDFVPILWGAQYRF